MESLENTLLVRTPELDPLEALREDIEDTLKEYGELDLLVELIQIALDSIDSRRYGAICESASLDLLCQLVISSKCFSR